MFRTWLGAITFASLHVTFSVSAQSVAEAEPEAQPAPNEVVSITFEQGDGLVFESRDDQFSLAIRPRAQFLAVLTAPEENLGTPPATGDLYADVGDVDLMFNIRRARVVFAGYGFGRANRFKVELAFSPADLGFEPNGGPTRTPLLDWYTEFRHLRDLSVRIGQYKLPFNRERVISSGDLAMVDRSISNAEFNIDRDLGFDFRSADFLGLGLLRYYVGLSAGEGRDAGFGNDLGFWYFARVEVLPLGLFDDYAEADQERHTQPRLSIGVAYAFLDDAPRLRGALGSRAADGGTTDYHQMTADLVFKYAGLNLYGEMIYRNGYRNPGNATDEMGMPLAVTAPLNGIGWFAQVGYLLPTIDLEFSARVGMVHPIGASTGISERGELGAALSYYVANHSLKLQADYFHLWQDGNFRDSSDRVRVQLQVAL